MCVSLSLSLFRGDAYHSLQGEVPSSKGHQEWCSVCFLFYKGVCGQPPSPSPLAHHIAMLWRPEIEARNKRGRKKKATMLRETKDITRLPGSWEEVEQKKQRQISRTKESGQRGPGLQRPARIGNWQTTEATELNEMAERATEDAMARFDPRQGKPVLPGDGQAPAMRIPSQRGHGMCSHHDRVVVENHGVLYCVCTSECVQVSTHLGEARPASVLVAKIACLPSCLIQRSSSTQLSLPTTACGLGKPLLVMINGIPRDMIQYTRT